MIEAVINGLIQGSITIIFILVGGKILLKKLLKTSKNEIKSEFEAWINSEKGRLALYSLGALLGNGLKRGAGFGGKGKMKLEEMVLSFAKDFIFGGKKIPEGQTNPIQKNPVNRPKLPNNTKKWFE